MVNIDPSYDVVLTYSPIVEITGHLFECFDYWLVLRSRWKTGILFFGGLDMDGLRVAWESKYNVPFSEVEKDIIYMPMLERTSDYKVFSFGHGTRVLLCDGNIKSLDWNRMIFSTDRLYGFLCEYDDFHKMQFNKHIKYLADYRVYGRPRFFDSFDYVKKLPFRYYRKVETKTENVGMMYVTFKCRMVSPDIILKYHWMSRCEKTILIVPYRKEEFDGIPGVEQVVAPVDDLFSKFNTYIYTPVGRKFDCSPRLVTECFFQGRNVFKDLDYFDSGLEVRYEDASKRLETLDLTEDDEIFKILA
jgi:hypothetical protein